MKCCPNATCRIDSEIFGVTDVRERLYEKLCPVTDACCTSRITGVPAVLFSPCHSLLCRETEMSRLNPLIRSVPKIRCAESSDSQTIRSVVVSGRIPLLDGFRAVAVVLVVLSHGCQMSNFPFRQELQSALFEGQIGVDIFFVLSGFLITSLLVREKRRSGAIAIGQFFLRRSIRILPAYAAFLFVVLLFESAGTPTLRWSDWLGALTYTTNFLSDPGWRLGHLWSLSIEEHFYLVWPFVFSLLPHRICWMAPAACILVSVVLRTVLYFEFPDVAWMANRWTFTRCDAIFVGCLLSLVASSGFKRYWPLKFISVIHPATFVIALVVSIILGRTSFAYATILAPVINGTSIGGLIGSCLIRSDSRSVRWLDHRILKAIGVRSYSIYLWQQVVLVPDAKSIGGIWLFDFVVVLMIAEASWRLIECPALRLKGWACRKTLPSFATPAYDSVTALNGFGAGNMGSALQTAQIHRTENDTTCGGERVPQRTVPLSGGPFHQQEQITNA